jgi:hypothetical protein
VFWLQDELRDAVLLVFANKQDLPNAMNAAEITDKLGLHGLRQRHWWVGTGDGCDGAGCAGGWRPLGSRHGRNCLLPRTRLLQQSRRLLVACCPACCGLRVVAARQGCTCHTPPLLPWCAPPMSDQTWLRHIMSTGGRASMHPCVADNRQASIAVVHGPHNAAASMCHASRHKGTQ